MPLWKKVKLYNLSVRGLSHKMARKSPPRTVFVSKPLNMGYNDAMSRLRQWLDSKRLESTGFKITAEGPIGFEISFSSEHDAAEFQLALARRSPGRWEPPGHQAAAILIALHATVGSAANSWR
jgi:hypothetical protein